MSTYTRTRTNMPTQQAIHAAVCFSQSNLWRSHTRTHAHTHTHARTLSWRCSSCLRSGCRRPTSTDAVRVNPGEQRYGRGGDDGGVPGRRSMPRRSSAASLLDAAPMLGAGSSSLRVRGTSAGWLPRCCWRPQTLSVTGASCAESQSSMVTATWDCTSALRDRDDDEVVVVAVVAAEGMAAPSSSVSTSSVELEAFHVSSGASMRRVLRCTCPFLAEVLADDGSTGTPRAMCRRVCLSPWRGRTGVPWKSSISSSSKR